MASLKNYFKEEPDFIPEPPEKTADDYVQPVFETINEGLTRIGISPEAAQRSIDRTRKVAGQVVLPLEGELPSDYAKIEAAFKGVNQDIPVVATSARTDLPKAEAKAIPASNAANPAPPVVGTSGGMKTPAVEAGSGGDDDVRNLYLARLAAQSAAGFGGMGAGKNIDIGIADTLGERMKQIEALRAKREERSMELAREDEQSSALVQQYKSLAAQGLVPELPLLDKLPPKQAAGLIKTYGSLPGMAAKAAETTALTPVKVASGLATAAGKEAQTAFVVEKTGRVRELLPLEVEQKKAQTAKINADIDLRAKQFASKEKEALAAPGKNDTEKAIKLNELAEKEKGFGGYVTLANDLSELEAAAPGFVTRGEAPEWLTAAQQSLGQNWPTSADPRVVKFLAAYGKLANAERHRLYGSAQTAGELKAFLQQLNDNPFSSGPETLATQMSSFAGNVGRRATNTLNRYSSVFGAPVVDQVLGGEFRPLYEDGAVFSTFKTPFAAPTPASAAGGAPAPAPAVGGVERVVMLDPEGKKRAVRADQVKKAEGQGWRMP